MTNSTVLEHLPHIPKIEGSKPDTDTERERERQSDTERERETERDRERERNGKKLGCVTMAKGMFLSKTRMLFQGTSI